MATTYFIELSGNKGEPVQVAIRRGNQVEIIGRDGFRPDPSARAIAFGSCLSITLHRAPLPARNEADALKAALFAIEDDLAQPVQDIHIALGPKVAAGDRRDIYAIDKALLQDWISTLAMIGLPDASIIPELSLLADAPLLVDLEDRLLVGTGDRKYGVDTALPREAIDALVRPDGDVPPVAGRRLAEALASPAIRDVRTPSLLELVHMLDGAAPIDIRTGAYALKSRTQGKRRWNVKTLATLAIAALTLWFTSVVLELNNLTRETDRLARDSSARYAALFPGEPMPADLAATARIRLTAGERSTSPSFLTVMAHIYDSLGAVNGARIRAIDFDRAEGTLSISLGFAAFGDDVSLRRALEEKGFVAQIGDARQDGAEILSVVVIEMHS